MNKIVKGQANSHDYDLLKHLSELKINSLKTNFDISEGFLDIFMEEK